MVVTENNLISSGAQKYGLLGRFSEYGLTAHDLDSGLAVNKGFRNVQDRGLDSNLNNLLNEREEKKFDRKIDEN